MLEKSSQPFESIEKFAETLMSGIIFNEADVDFRYQQAKFPEPAMLVCHCHALTDRDICRSVRLSGADSVAEVGDHCGAATGCGGCYEAVADIVACEKRRLAVLQESGKPARDLPGLPGLALTG